MARVKKDKSDKIDAKFLKNLSVIASKKGGNVSQVCKALNISRNTFYRYYNTNNDFKTVYDDACEEIIDFAEGMLIDKVRQGSERAIEFFLTNKRPDRWKHRRTETLEGSARSPLQVLVEQKKQELKDGRKKNAAIKKAYKSIGIDRDGSSK